MQGAHEVSFDDQRRDTEQNQKYGIDRDHDLELLRCGRRLGPLISAGSLSVDVDGDADATQTETLAA